MAPSNEEAQEQWIMVWREWGNSPESECFFLAVHESVESVAPYLQLLVCTSERVLEYFTKASVPADTLSTMRSFDMEVDGVSKRIFIAGAMVRTMKSNIMPRSK